MEPTPLHSNSGLSGLYDIRRLKTAVEVLNNLIYLASVEAENPERVRTYLKLAEKEVAALTQGVRKTRRRSVKTTVAMGEEMRGPQ
jgi:hypothetical protein